MCETQGLIFKGKAFESQRRYHLCFVHIIYLFAITWCIQHVKEYLLIPHLIFLKVRHTLYFKFVKSARGREAAEETDYSHISFLTSLYLLGLPLLNSKCHVYRAWPLGSKTHPKYILLQWGREVRGAHTWDHVHPYAFCRVISEPKASFKMSKCFNNCSKINTALF